jgi:hypothetical protein
MAAAGAWSPGALGACALWVLAACSGGSAGGGTTDGDLALKPLAILTDGSPVDVAVSDDTLWIAQGRRLAVIDATTLVRLPQEELEFDRSLRAVDYDPASGELLVLTEDRLGRRLSTAGPWDPLWDAPDGVLLHDVASVDGELLVLASKRLYVLELDLGAAVVRHEVALEESGTSMRAFRAASGAVRAGVVVQVTTEERLVNGLALVSFGDEEALLEPGAFSNGEPTVSPTWLPDKGSAEASVESFALVVDAEAGVDLAWVAAGLRTSEAEGEGSVPYVEVLDITDPSTPRHVAFVDLPQAPGEAAHKLVYHAESGRMFLTTEEHIFAIDAASRTVLGELEAPFRRDRAPLVLQNYPLGLCLWSLEREPVSHNLRSFDVSGAAPLLRETGWWWVGCDTAVYAPAWRSLYVTTFGGVVRFDVSDPLHPLLAGGYFSSTGSSYAPSTGVTEDAALLSAGGSSRLLTARGSGGFDAYPVSAAAPDPGPATPIPSDLPNFTYNNAVEVYQAPLGALYALTDATAATPGGTRFFLEAARYHAESGTFSWSARTVGVVPPEEIQDPLTSNLAIEGRFAFVGARGLFFVVDLADLPGALPVRDVVTVAVPGSGNVFVRGIAPAGKHLFVALRGAQPGESEVRVYAFDEESGDVDEVPVARVAAGDPGVPEDFNLFERARLSPDKQRLFICGPKGKLFGFDVADPLAPRFAGAWQSPGEGLGADCRVEVLKFPDGTERPVVVFVTVAETFKLLQID